MVRTGFLDKDEQKYDPGFKGERRKVKSKGMQRSTLCCAQVSLRKMGKCTIHTSVRDPFVTDKANAKKEKCDLTRSTLSRESADTYSSIIRHNYQ